MNKKLYFKLGFQNIKANKNSFVPFGICTGVMVALCYMLISLFYNMDKQTYYGDATMQLIIGFGVRVCEIFSFIVIIYTNSFLIKRRSKELGLYSILGMEKKHIMKVIFWEICDIGIISISAGLIVGCIFSKLSSLLFQYLIRIQANAELKFTKEAVIETIVVFCGVYFVIILMNCIRIIKMKPIELLRSKNVGEKEPKAHWVYSILGILSLGIGYYIAFTIIDPIKALNLFFVAVIFVIVGTYLVFISVSIVVLKILKKNKNIYYSKNHFITISGLIYRMKQNAVGLANICILSTAVLVVLSSTVTLFIGTEDSLKAMHPNDVNIKYLYMKGMEGEVDSEYDYSKVEDAIYKHAKNYNVKIVDFNEKLNLMVMGKMKNNSFEETSRFDQDTVILEAYTQDYYNEKYKDNIKLNENEIVYGDTRNSIKNGKVKLFDKEYKVIKTNSNIATTNPYYLVNENIVVIVKDDSELIKMRNDFNQKITKTFTFNLEGNYADKKDFSKFLRTELEKVMVSHLSEVDNIYTSRDDIFKLYGSLLYIGIFIGLLFIMTTIMIIYYKQISEGYEDRERFQILKKVGMSDIEVKGTIWNQILLVFTLPIILAIIHICFAFAAIKRIMVIFAITKMSLLVGCFAITAIIFILAYIICYGITARTYFKIVYKQ